MIDPHPYTVELHLCHDCAALPGYEHSIGCDVARCPICGAQRISCYEHKSAAPSIWTGIWPGEIECVEFGYWSKWVDENGKPIDFLAPGTQGHWEETTADDPDRQPDLNKLNAFNGRLVWSRRLQRFVKRDYQEVR